MSETIKNHKKPFKLTGWHFLAIMCSFFGVIILVNIVFVTRALNAFSGLVVKNSYVASQHYNGKIAQAKQQKLLNWNLDLLVNKQGVDFILINQQKQPITGKLVTVKLRLTKNAATDMSLLLNEKAPGHYFAKLPNNATTPNGTWLIDLDILQDNKLYYHYEESRSINFQTPTPKPIQ